MRCCVNISLRNIGLSPRVRGNLARCRKPDRPWIASSLLSVYPRVCGGTYSNPGHRYNKGLSPRVRGNRTQEHGWPDCQGSIPACAGEPPTYPSAQIYVVRSIPACAGEPAGLRAPTCHRVYPRVCGGTAVPVQPADKVYPRVCGGTPFSILSSGQWGLSPRVRGNQQPPPRRNGSIPACAGEPTPSSP